MSQNLPPRHTGGAPRPTDPQELAELYAAGMLSAPEQAEFDARVNAGDPALLREVERVRPVIECLAGSRSVEPPAHVLARVEARIARAPEPAAGTPAESEAARAFVIHRADERRWRRSGLPGVWIQKLHGDRALDRETTLLKCDPGAYIPDHEHQGIEEMIVLEGELCVGELLLKAGDYFRILAGAEHGEIHSPTGCVCLLFTSHGAISVRSRLGMLWDSMVRRFGGR